MSMHWVVIADAASAKVYAGDELLEELHHVRDVAHPSHGAMPGAGHNAKQAHHDPHIVGEERYARAVAEVVNEAAGKHLFQRLVLVAPPHFLGDLRAELSTTVTKGLVGSIHHDWTKVPPRELAARVRKELPQVFGLD